MKTLATKTEVNKFGVIKINKTVDKMVKIMSDSFGASNFYQMSD
jgi:hypothetical protein